MSGEFSTDLGVRAVLDNLTVKTVYGAIQRSAKIDAGLATAEPAKQREVNPGRLAAVEKEFDVLFAKAVADNTFEETAEASVVVDDAERWSDLHDNDIFWDAFVKVIARKYAGVNFTIYEKFCSKNSAVSVKLAAGSPITIKFSRRHRFCPEPSEWVPTGFEIVFYLDGY